MLCWVQGNFFISFFVLTNALEDPVIIGGKAIDLVNTIFRYSYVGLLLSCFILSLGNRPQGSNVGYTLAFVGYAIFTVYMTVGQPRLSSTQESANGVANTVCCDHLVGQGRAAGGCCGTSWGIT